MDYQKLLNRANGLQNDSFVVLFYIYENPNCNCGDISSELEMGPLRVTECINELKERGLILSDNGTLKSQV